MRFIDTHCHLDGEEFRDDLEAVVAHAQEVGVGAIGIPGIDLASCDTVLAMCRRYPNYCYPMLGLHPEEVKADWQNVLKQIKPRLNDPQVIAIGEVGLDFYWSREFEKAQLAAFEEQVKWSIELQLPLMIHCRKAQNELVAILKRYKDNLPGGVFHCFTGNELEAKELLHFERFVLGIGGVLTFKKSHLPEVLPACVPLDRIVLETDAPYMAPVPMRGKRNEPAFVVHVLQSLAEAYGIDAETVASQTSLNCENIKYKSINSRMCAKNTTFASAKTQGEVLEWLKRHAWKACIRQKRIGGSNPPLSAEY